MLSQYHPQIKQLKEEIFNISQERLIWAFLSFMMGIVFYFYGLSFLPGACVLFLSTIFLILFRKRNGLFFIFFIITFMMIGCLVAHGREKTVVHPVLDKKFFHIELNGKITNAVNLPDKQIIILEDIKYPSAVFKQPHKIRLNYYQNLPLLKTGQTIALRAHIMPPLATQGPFHSSQAKRLYFEKIGAIGKIEKVLKTTESSNEANVFERLRQKIAQRVFDILPENQARIITPLITGEQRFVSQELYQIYRRSGIVHVLSVSGFHMALLAGFLFLLIRSVGVIFGKATLYVNTKKIAAVFALIGTGFYLALSGFQIPAIRSFGMIALVFLGILIDRKAFSIRSLILIGFIMLLLQPENLISISFQLSFLSVLILISVHEKFKKLRSRENKHANHLIEFFTLNIAITLGLMPLIVWHFNQITPYALLGNTAFSFIFSLIIMPLLFTGCLFMPFGWDAIFLKIAGFFINLIQQMAEYIAQFAYAEINMPSFNIIALGMMVLGIIFICLWKNVGKAIGILLIIIGFVMAVFTRYPDIIVADKGQSIAYIKDNTFYYNKNGEDWIQNLWQQKMGKSQTKQINFNQTIFIKNKKIALNPHYCQGADFAILSHPDINCRGQKLIPKENEIYFIYLNEKDIRIETLSE